MMTKSWLSENNISFIEKNIEREGVADELIALGYKVTPVVVIKTSAPVARGIVKGEQVVVGYNTKKLAEALNIEAKF